MTSTNFLKFDSLLSKHDSDSMDWCDGGGRELAADLMEKFCDADWASLNDGWKSKDDLWKGCLVSALSPKYGEVAQDMIIEMAFDNNSDIAFGAMQKVSFYCGVNANTEGLFYDENTVDHGFFEKVRSNHSFIDSIPDIGKSVGRRYELLMSILVGMP